MKYYFFILLIFLSACSSDSLDCDSKSPVCGKIDVVCVTAPCDPVSQSYASECEAIKSGAHNITKGEC